MSTRVLASQAFLSNVLVSPNYNWRLISGLTERIQLKERQSYVIQCPAPSSHSYNSRFVSGIYKSLDCGLPVWSSVVCNRHRWEQE